MEQVIYVENLKRDYIKTKGFFHRKKTITTAVNGISFDVKRGEIFGILGENGAGKTTTIKMLITLLAPTSGVCRVLGYNTFGEEKKIRSRINFIFGGEMGVYRRLSGRDNLQYFANLYHIPGAEAKRRINEVLEIVGLSDRADSLVETYSKGMIQRLQIARGLMNDAEILFMDEPTIGLDPLGARALRDLIRKLKEHGKTIVLTTHYLYEADELCDRIAIMNKGKIVALDTPQGLKQLLDSTKTMELAIRHSMSNYCEKIKGIRGVRSVEFKEGDESDIYLIKYDRELDILSELLKITNDITSF
jgi:ABC-2 type transport system ATP-binding protein